MNDRIASENGDNLVLQNVKGSKMNALTLYGKSEQETTTGAQLFDYYTILSNQITAGVVHIDADGRIILDGKFDYENRRFSITLSPGTYTLSADAPNIWHILAPADSLFNQTLQVDEITTYKCYIASGTYDRTATTPMINQGSKALPWEPYTGGQPSPNPDYPQEIKSVGDSGTINVTLSDGGSQSQTLPVQTPNGLPGIPVSSGGNYTDESGQQWVCDEIDLARGKYVQRVKKFVVTSDTDISSMNPYSTAALDVVQPFRVHEYDGQIIKSSAMMAKNFVVKAVWNTAQEAANTVAQTIDFNILNERIGTSAESTSEEAVVAVREWLKDNPLTFLCQLITPIETDLTAEEIAAYKALHTYSPTTTVSNDAGAWMKVGYREWRR